MSVSDRPLQNLSRPGAPSIAHRPSFATVLLLFIFMCLGGFAQVTDFALDTRGPHHVVQGHYMFFSVTGRVLAGNDNESGTVPSLSGLPAGATGQFVDMARYCCGTILYGWVGDQPIKISTSS